jgi:hypothetical protein
MRALKILMSILLTSMVMSFSELPSGIFIIKKPGRKNPCEQELKMLIGGRKVCVLKKPIIHAEDIEYVTDILYDPILKRNHVNVGLSASSVRTLNRTVSSITKPEFAIVVNDNVIGIFMINERLTENFLRVGTDLDLKDLEAVKDALSGIIREKPGKVNR